MLNRVLLRSIVAVVAVAVSGVTARADFVIDTFTSPNPAHSYSLGSAVGSTFTATDLLPAAITRDTRIELLANDFGEAITATGVLGTPPSGPPRFSLSTVAGATAYAALKYTYGVWQDLSAAGTALRFTFLFADLNTPFSVSITDADDITAVESGTVTAAGSGVYSIPISNFSGVDMTRVKSITLTLNRDITRPDQPSTTSADFTLSDVRITTPSVVPAPAALILGLFGVPALAVCRVARRRMVS